MKQTSLQPLMLSPVADALRRPFPEIRLLPDGAFAARDGRPGNLTEGILNTWTLSQPFAGRLLDLWRQRETPLVIDYEHQSLNTRLNGQPAPAAGWIETLRYEAGQGLFAAVRWTDGAKAFIERDEYRFISPVFSFDPTTGDVLELKGAALTNVPALDGLGAVAATDAGLPEPVRPEGVMNALQRLKQLLGLPPEADENSILAELDRLEGLLGAASDDPGTPATLLERLQAGLPPAALSTLVQSNTALRDQLCAALNLAEGDRVGRSIEAAVADGRLSRELVGWATDLGRREPAVLESFLSAVTPVAALTSFQSAGNRTALSAPIASSLSAEERFVCEQLGLSDADYMAVRGA